MCRSRGRPRRRDEVLSREPSITNRLAQSDPGNAQWQRDLAVCHNKIGEVQVAQGDLAGALNSYRDSLSIRDRLANPIPATPSGSAICSGVQHLCRQCENHAG